MLNPGVYVFGLIFFAFCFSLSISNSRRSGSLTPPVRPAGMTAAGVSPPDGDGFMEIRRRPCRCTFLLAGLAAAGRGGR
jgi:hypothetical protein